MVLVLQQSDPARARGSEDQTGGVADSGDDVSDGSAVSDGWWPSDDSDDDCDAYAGTPGAATSSHHQPSPDVGGSDRPTGDTPLEPPPAATPQHEDSHASAPSEGTLPFDIDQILRDAMSQMSPDNQHIITVRHLSHGGQNTCRHAVWRTPELTA